MARRPVETVQVNLRIKEGLRRKLERAAQSHQTSLNNEMRLRLEDSLEREAKRDLDEVATELKANWLRYSERFMRLDLEEQLAEALARTQDPEVAKLATAWLATRRGGKP